MKLTAKQLALAIASASLLALYGCGGGGGGGSPVAAGSPVATDTSSMTVTPSLGRFSAGTVVELRRLDGSLISSGSIAADGTAKLALLSYTGPVVVKVLGAVGVTFYDEGTNSSTPFGVGQVLNAVMAAPQIQVGVTPMTNAAYVLLGTVDANTSTTAIRNVNRQVATVFGLPDILQAPTAVGAQGANLDIANQGDKYALMLAALAKTANTGKSAADVAKDLAEDLKDGILDGKNATSTTTPTVVLLSYNPGTLTAKYEEAAKVFATESSQALITTAPLGITTSPVVVTTAPLAVMTTPVASVTVLPDPSPIDQAKALFSELRTTLNSFANNSKTGFLDTQAQAMGDDLNANVASDMSRLSRRIQQVGVATTAYEDVLAYTAGSPNGFVTGAALGSVGLGVLTRTNGSLGSVWSGRNNYEFCWADSITPAAISQIKCFAAAADGADIANNRINGMIYVLTKTGSNQYSYIATRYFLSSPLTSPTFNQPVTDADGNPIPTGSGTISTAFSGSTRNAFTINGTLPPSASGSKTNTVTTGVDTIAITASRTTLTGNNYRYALTGSTATSKLKPTVGTGVDPSKTTTVSFDSGSYFDVDETNASTTGYKLIGTKVIGTIKTLATQFTGTLDLTAPSNDADGTGFAPTNIAFNGKLSDITPTTGVGQILTGNLQLIVSNYGQYHSTAVQSSSNFLKGTLTFSGTIKMPDRPLMSMNLGLVKSNYLGHTLTLNYTYGSTSITGSGSRDGVNSANDTMTLSNQDGIMVVTTTTIFTNTINNTRTNIITGAVTKSGSSLATVTSSRINYVDGSTESLN